MEKFHGIVKHFSSVSANRKNYDSALHEHRCLPSNRLDQDHNGTRIVALNRLLKSALTLKIGTHTYCNKFNMPPFFIDEEWKTMGEFEAILRDASRLITICLNEKKINWCLWTFNAEVSP